MAAPNGLASRAPILRRSGLLHPGLRGVHDASAFDVISLDAIVAFGQVLPAGRSSVFDALLDLGRERLQNGRGVLSRALRERPSRKGRGDQKALQPGECWPRSGCDCRMLSFRLLKQKELWHPPIDSRLR
jgi:hypothetical protein